MTDTVNPAAPPPSDAPTTTPAAALADLARADAAPPSPPPPAAPPPRTLNPYAASRVAPPAAAAPAPAPAAPPPAPNVEALAADVAGLRAALAESVNDTLATMPAGVQKTVRDLAGDDPIAQRRVLSAMRANGLATPPPVIPTGATTAPTQPAPAPAPVVSPDDAALAEYERMHAAGAPIRATAFLAQNRAAIERARAARTARN